MTDEIVLRHHAAQKLIGRQMISELAPLWEILRFHDLQESTGPWLKTVRPVIERGYLTSQYVAAEFVRNYRAALFPSAEPLAIDLPPNPLGLFGSQMIQDREAQLRIMVSMKVTGPVYVAKQMPMEESAAMAQGFSKSSGAATRLVLNGGRGMVRLLADADQLAVGVQSVADEDSCASCRLLASRPILKTEGTRKMHAVAVGHDYCKCSAQLVY